MRIRPIETQPTFGYKHELKTLWKNGKLPTVKKGFYGDILTKDNVTLEHLKPHSKGGGTDITNLVLASKNKNNARGCEPLKLFVNSDMVKAYLEQFKNIKLPTFNGNKYIEFIQNTVRKLGVKI